MSIHPPIILASQSPRRRLFLRQLLGNDDFVIQPADIDEQFAAVSPEENAKRLSLEKARAVQLAHPDSIIIASDTIVAVDDEQLAKPADRAEAEQMLRRLAGKTIAVITGLAVLAPGREVVAVETTGVVFRPAAEPGVTQALEVYLDSGDWADKAGAFGIQSGAGPLIAGIKGHYSVIVGLPVEQLAEILHDEFGIATHPVEAVLPDGITQL